MNITPTVRNSSALVGITGALLLSGCASPALNEAEGTSGPVESAATTPSPTTSASSADGTNGYADGTYTADGSYRTPESVEQISVTVTLTDGIVGSVEVSGNPQAHESTEYQGKFIGGIAEVVVGKPIDEISVDRVAGSSLTGEGFNQAIEKIREQAAA